MPETSGSKTINGDVEVPMGKTIKNPNGGYMGVNEFIVYDIKQVKLPYLIKFRMWTISLLINKQIILRI